MSIATKQQVGSLFIAGLILLFISVKYRSQNHYIIAIQCFALATILYILLSYLSEPFHFELSPSKTVNCCAKGFSGAPIEFHYDGDNTRFNNCPEQPPKLLANPNNYDFLGQTYSTTEGFTSNYDTLGETYKTSEPFTSNYDTLGQTYKTREGYQSTQYEKYNNLNKYENLQQVGQDVQPFVIVPGKEHHSIYDMYTGPTPDIFNMGDIKKEGYCGSCTAGPNM